MQLMRNIVETHGVPDAVYTDRKAIFGASMRFKKVGERSVMTSQFTRAVETMGTTVIRAYSPQAKGRIERVFRTLQDRLVQYLEAHQARNVEEANKVLNWYVPRHNKWFSKAPRNATSAWVPLPEHLDLDDVFCNVWTRVVAKDNTIRLRSRVIQLPLRPSLPKSKVDVHERFDGSIRIYHGPEPLITLRADRVGDD